MNPIWRRVSRRNDRPPVAALPLATLPWLTATAVVTLAPHYGNIPPWLALAVFVVLLSRLWYWREGRLTPPRYLTFLLICVGLASILSEYRTLVGREAGVALLTVFMSLKLFELRTRRDAVVVVMLGYFLLLTHYFYADEIWIGAWMFLALVLTTGTLIRLQTPNAAPPRETLYLAARMILQAMPIMAILFLLFPRISGPLWGLPQDSRRATSGLTEEMSPGSISELSQSSAVAFRVEFVSPPPPREQLYWRGPVMTDYDGRAWRVARGRDGDLSRVPVVSGRGPRIDYWVTLEPHQQRWLLALDMPLGAPTDGWLSPTFSLLNRSAVRERYRYSLVSTLDYRAGIQESSSVMQASLALPANLNPQARALAARWSQESKSPHTIAAKALRMFQQEAFVYTLRPPLLGENAIDEFLFASRRGFCEHYAAAFVFLMRAAAVPARVVGGYQGGDINPIDNHLTVRQSDAHAWAEIWVPDEGWVRVDPTAAIAPSRIEQGLQASLPKDEPLPALMRLETDWIRALRYRWDALNNGWNLWVLAYNADRQKQILQRIGLGTDWKNLVGLLSLTGGLALLGIAAWILRGDRERDPVQRLWTRACARFARQGVPRLPWEGPQTYLARVAKTRPDLAPLAQTVTELYIPLRYGVANDDSLAKLRRTVRRIPHRWRFSSCRTR
jgi:protein-glutamine gamma-glutamyltransferase